MGFKSILNRLNERRTGAVSRHPNVLLQEEQSGESLDSSQEVSSSRSDRCLHTPECSVGDLEELSDIALSVKGQEDGMAIDLLLSHDEPMKAELVGIALYSTNAERACYVPIWSAGSRESESRSRCESAAIPRPVLEDAWCPLTHEAKKQIAFLLRHGIRLRGLRSDTAIAAYLLNPDSSSYSLSDLLFRYTEDRFVPESALYGRGSNTPQYHDIVEVPPEEVARRYSRAVCELPYLADLLDSKVKEVGMDGLWHEVELPLVQVLARMELQE